MAVIAVGIALSGLPAHSQPLQDSPDADSVYAQAVQALHRQDCAEASAGLRKYIKLAPATLAARPEFSEKIQRQLRLCDARVENNVLIKGDRPFDRQGKVRSRPQD